MNNTYKIIKTENSSGDIYVEVFKNDKIVMKTLWLGESDSALLKQAENFSK